MDIANLLCVHTMIIYVHVCKTKARRTALQIPLGDAYDVSATLYNQLHYSPGSAVCSGSVAEVVRGWIDDRVALTAAEVMKCFTANTGSPSKVCIVIIDNVYMFI